ncbi:hypothetical protein [Saccharolobus solfataricus]|uniref:Uncharacterized protein n=1 Tax=Saccharolobus solfataricus (strain 98/2) TaxID=555311 RepID=D0KVD7_SACS9|nr:hypothetical protein [Saccharolobus solfataricus]
MELFSIIFYKIILDYRLTGSSNVHLTYSIKNSEREKSKELIREL